MNEQCLSNLYHSVSLVCGRSAGHLNVILHEFIYWPIWDSVVNRAIIVLKSFFLDLRNQISVKVDGLNAPLAC